MISSIFIPNFKFATILFNNIWILVAKPSNTLVQINKFLGEEERWVVVVRLMHKKRGDRMGNHGMYDTK